jgi:hypothetical protein
VGWKFREMVEGKRSSSTRLSEPHLFELRVKEGKKVRSIQNERKKEEARLRKREEREGGRGRRKRIKRLEKRLSDSVKTE